MAEVEITPYEDMTREELIECCHTHDKHHEEHHEKERQLRAEMMRWKNTYDAKDCIRRKAVMCAGPLKVAAYEVRNLETGEFDLPTQYHMTYDNIVLAVLSQSSAELLAKFIKQGGAVE